MEIRYSDLYGKPLTAQQIVASKEYIKIFEENNRFRKKEYYEDGELEDTVHYIESGTSHQELLIVNPSILKIIEIEDINANYIKFQNFRYIDGVLVDKGIEISNSDGLSIMVQDLDIHNNQPINHTTYKYYMKDAYEFEFLYHSSGELVSVVVTNDTLDFFEQYRFSELNIIPNFEWWEQYSPYYLNAEPAIPNGIIIT